MRNKRHQTDKEKRIHAMFRKGGNVKIRSGDLQGEIGEIKKVTDDEGQRFLQIKLRNKNKTIEKSTDEVKLLEESEIEPSQTIADLQGRDDLILVQQDQEVQELRDMLPDKKSVKDFDGFFVKVGDGELTEVFGFEGSVPSLDTPIQKLETPEQFLKRKVK